MPYGTTFSQYGRNGGHYKQVKCTSPFQSPPTAWNNSGVFGTLTSLDGRLVAHDTEIKLTSWEESPASEF